MPLWTFQRRMEGPVDASFAAFYGAHIMKAYNAQMSDELKAVRRARLEKDEARRSCFRRYFVINAVELLYLSLRFFVLAFSFIFGFLVFLLAVCIVCAWGSLFILPFAKAACYHHTLPPVDYCYAAEWKIPDTNVTLPSFVMNELYVAFKSINTLLSQRIDLDAVCTSVYHQYSMDFKQIKRSQKLNQ